MKTPPGFTHHFHRFYASFASESILLLTTLVKTFLESSSYSRRKEEGKIARWRKRRVNEKRKKKIEKRKKKKNRKDGQEKEQKMRRKVRGKNSK